MCQKYHFTFHFEHKMNEKNEGQRKRNSKRGGGGGGGEEMEKREQKTASGKKMRMKK